MYQALSDKETTSNRAPDSKPTGMPRVYLCGHVFPPARPSREGVHLNHQAPKWVHVSIDKCEHQPRETIYYTPASVCAVVRQEPPLIDRSQMLSTFGYLVQHADRLLPFGL
jgi:hypothetical protein